MEMNHNNINREEMYLINPRIRATCIIKEIGVEASTMGPFWLWWVVEKVKSFECVNVDLNYFITLVT